MSRGDTLKARWARFGKQSLKSEKQRLCKHCGSVFTIESGNQLFCHTCRKKCMDENGKIDLTKWARLKDYGLLPETFDAMWQSQRGCCPLCNRELSFGKKGPTCLHVDHDHQTKKVRGLLCRSCNNSLGFIERDEKWLERAFAYIAKHKGTKCQHH